MGKEVFFRSGTLRLQGRLHSAKSGRAAVICHPHPLYGGEMHNNVVEALAGALAAADFWTLRFNFRGVGRSEGRFDNGAGECADVLAAIEYLKKESGAEKIALCGYSFGAAIAARAGASAEAVSALVLMALPLALMPADELLACAKPKLFIAGGRDEIAPVANLDAFYHRAREPKEFLLLERADHFFLGQEETLSKQVVRFLQTALLS